MKRPSKKKLLEVIRNSHGLIYPIAVTFDVTRMTVYNWIKQDEEIQKAVEEARENMIDVVESKYLRRAMEGSERAQEFILKTLGKNRGYSERQEVTGSDGEPLQITGMVIK